MVEQTFDFEPIQNDTRGSVYNVSSGSTGFKASIESVKVWREEDGTYKINFSTPTNVTEKENGIETASEAIVKARKIAGRSISKGMPGSGKIDVPDFDMDSIPEEP
jgi:hypothetical protein